MEEGMTKSRDTSDWSWMEDEPWEECEEECDHPNAYELEDCGTYVRCWCPDCEIEFDDQW